LAGFLAAQNVAPLLDAPICHAHNAVQQIVLGSWIQSDDSSAAGRFPENFLAASGLPA
jgi:hypothetical protein